MNTTKNSLVTLLFALAFAFLGMDTALASVTVTPASGGGSISADTAASAPSPAWTSLGAITIVEGSSTLGDFAAGTGVTLVLKAPAGFEFNTAVTPDVTFTASKNITSATLAMTDASTITITLTVVGTTQRDTLTIGSATAIQVRPTPATPLASGNITVATTSTETVTGITKGSTSMGALTEVAGAATKLAFGVQPSTTAAGASITPAVTVIVQDQFGNTVTGNSSSVTIASSTTAFTGSTLTVAAASGVATFSAIKPTTAGSANTLTASDGSLTGATSNPFTVNPAAANKLVIVTPPSSTATAGIAFDQQPVIWIEDTYSNLRTSDTLTVTAARLGGAGTLQGTTAIAAVGGIATFSNLSHPLVSSITITFTSGALTAATSGTIAVSAGTFSQLQVLLPGETAAPGTATGKTSTPSARTAGTAFTVTVNAVDANWNLINTVTDMAGITSSDATAVLPANASLVAGTQTFSVTFKDAGSQTVTATDIADGTKTGTSSSVTVNAGTVTKLQLLLPGETTAPGTTTGKTGTPNAETAGAAYTVTVNAVDANWNLASSTHTVAITTTDPNDVLPANAALVAGTKTFSVNNKTAGSWTVTATDTAGTGPLSPNTSPSFTVNPAAFAKLQILVPGLTAAPGTASGYTGSATAQNIDNPFTVTVNAVDANWNLVNTASDTVGITSTDANAALPANAALSSGTQTFSFRFNTAGGTRTITATDSSDGTKTANTSPAITVNVGAFAKLQVLMPGETAAPGTPSGISGSATNQQAGQSFNVTVRAVDGSWNLINTNDTVQLTSSDAQALLPANTALSGGSVTLALTFKTSGSQTATASDVTHTGIGSDTGTAIMVDPAKADHLTIATQPSATATAGVPFAQQPVIYIEDKHGNIRSNDTLVVTATRSAGAGTLQGTTNITAVGGIATFTDLAQGWATNITIQFANGALTAATSGIVAVSPGSFSQLLVVAPGQTNVPGTTSGLGGTVTAQTAGTAFAVKVMAVDAEFNLLTNVTDTVGITSSDSTAVLPANAALINGTNSFSVTINDAGSQTVTASDVTDGLTTGTSFAITIKSSALAKLQLLLPGEAAAPGTPTGKTGTPNAQTAGTAYSVTVNAVDANWNLVSTNDTVAINTTDINDVMPANTALVAGTKTFSVTNRTAGTWTMTASDITHTGVTANSSPSFTVNPAAFAKLQLLMPGETASPGSATGKANTPTAQNTDNPFTVTVNAVDANWNLVNTASDTVGITSSDPNAVLPSGAALSSGTQTFSVKFNTAGGTRTVTATDLTDGSKTANTGTATTVMVGAFAQLQILLPGETAAAGTTTGKTGSPTARIAGTAFNATVYAVDASYNLISTNDSVHLTSSDANAGLPANTAMVAGTVSLSVTLKTVGSWTVTASDATHAGIASGTSSTATANVGAFAKLQLLVPGESAAPGSATGKTGTPSAETAGTGYSVTVNAVDANWNLIGTNDTVKIVSTDANGVLPANAALVAGTQTFSLTNNTAGSWTVTASDVTHTSITANTSPAITVAAGAFARLQLLMPGETASAGTTTGKTGTPSARTAGTAFNVTVNAVDANWNVVGSATDTVDITCTDANAALPADAALVAGTQTLSVTLKTVGSATVTATDVTDGSKTANTSPSTTVGVGAFSMLQLLMPGETAAPGSASGKTGTPSTETAGTAFSVTVNGVDANWNKVTTLSGSSYTMHLVSSDANAALPADANLTSGTVSMSVTFKTAGSATLTASDVDDGSKIASTSPSTTVNTGAFVKLQLLVPGEAASPGSATGKTGTPSTENIDNPFYVTVNAVDANWNLIGTATDTVTIDSTDTAAALPPDTALSGGTQTFAVKFNTAGSRTITATDVTDGSKTANTSPSITVSVGAFAKLQVLMPGESAAPGTGSGKTGTPTTQTAGTAFTATVRSVDASWNLISTNDTVHITSSDAQAALPANAVLSGGSGSFSVTFKTTASQTVTASDVTHTGIASNTGTATAVNPAAASKLVIATQPSATATAGVVFAQQPVIYIEDTYNNIRSNDTLVVTATRSAGAGILQGTTNVTAMAGVATYTDLAQGWATNITIQFTSGALTAATSTGIAVSPGAYSQLLVVAPGQTNAPATATGLGGTATAQTARTAFAVKVMAVDAEFNLLTNVTDTVDITTSDSTAVLPADAALINGTNSFSVTFNAAGSQTVTASDVTDGITTGTSSTVTVNAGTVTKLQLLMPGEAAAPGTPTGKTGTPDAQTAGTAFTVTVNAVDANWNVASSTHSIAITSSDANAGLPANASLVAGTKTFSVTFKTAGNWTVTATDKSSGPLAPNTGSATDANFGAFTKLQLLVPGEAAAPGSATGKTGTPAAQNSDYPFVVTVNAVDANWNVVSSVTDTVTIDSSDANAALPPDAALSGGTQSFAVKFNTAGTRTITATDTTDGSKTANTSPNITVSAGAFAQLQILLPGETALPGTTVGKSGSPTARVAGTAFTVTVNAVDASHNVVSTNDLVHLISSDANAGLPADAAMSAGTKTFSVTLKTVGSWTVTVSDATHAGIASDTSSTVAANVGAFAKLQLLVPGETAAPGSASGKTGTPSVETAGTGYGVTVNAVDANWNLIGTNDTVKITSTDANDILPANAALVAGTGTFSLTNNTAGSWTVTASDVTHTSITANTSPAITVAAGAFAKLQLLMPGETASAGTTTGKTGTPSARTAGTAFNVTVNAVDAYWNVVGSATDTVDITSTDANAALPADAALVAGTQTLSVTLKTVGTATVTATDVTDGSKTANTSPSTTVGVGAFAMLQLLMPGETAAPGTSTGKTGTPDAETAGTAFTVTVNGVDANWNKVTTLSGSSYTMHLVSSDLNATLQADANLASGTVSMSVTFKTAGSATVTASDADSGTKTPSTSPATTVNAGAFAKVQLLMPGETAAAGSTTGKTGTPSAETAGTAFTVTVNGVDANWNLVNTAADTVGITSSDANADLPANANLSGGTQTFSVTLKTGGSRTVTATDITDGTKTANTSAATTVNAGAFTKLQLLMPGEAAAPGSATGKTGTPSARTAGTAFNATVNAVDDNWNLVSTITHMVGITGSDVNMTPPANAALAAGTKAFSVTFKTAGSATVTATDITDGTKLASTSPATTVNVGAFAKLQLLAPGEAAAPGSVLGKTGTPSAQTVGTAFTVTAASVDANWNPVNTNDTVHITSSDTSAVLPANAALSGGSQSFSVTLMTAGSVTVTASDATHGSIGSNTSPGITVNKGDQTITFGALANKNYGDPAFDPGATASSILAVTYAIVSGPATAAGSMVTITGAGTVTVRASQAGNANWNAATDVDQSFNVVQAALVVGAADQTRAYGALNPALSVNYFGFVNGDTTNVLSGSPELTTLAETNSPVGGYAIEITPGTLSNANYSFTFTNATLTVTQAILSVTADDQTRPYAQANPELTFSYSGFVNGQDTNILSGSPDISTSADTGSPATTYPITVTQGSLSVSDTNYSLAFVNGTLTVTPIALTVTADPQSKVYGESDPALTYQLTSGALVDGDNFSGSLVRAQGENVGPYAIQQGSLTAGSNYSLTFVSADLTITARPLTVTAGSQSKTYGQTVTFAGTEFTASGLASGETVTGVTLNSDGAAATAAVSGSPYAIVPSNAAGIDPANYSINYVNGSLTVGPATLTVSGITADNKPYDGTTTATIHTGGATLVGKIGADDVTLNTAGAAGAFADAAEGAGKTVSITGLTLDGGSAGNYSLEQPTTTADITSAGLIVAGIEANNRVYDGTTNATLNFANATLIGVASGEDVSLDTTNAVAAFGDKTVGTAKTVTITGLALFGADAGKYTLTQPATNADITAANLTVTGVAASDKVYDGTTAATLDTGSAALDGVISGDDVSLDAGSAAGVFSDAEAGANKTVTVSGITISGADVGNYALIQPAPTATITPASSALEVTSSANPSPTGSNLTLTATVSILPPGVGTAGGTVQFVVDGAPFGAPATLSGGVASLDSAALPHGSHTVAAEYAGSGNFQGSTNSLSEALLINTAPAAWSTTMSALKNQSTNLSASKLVSKSTDADGDSLSVTAVDTDSAEGGTVSLSGTVITYTPPADYTGPDSFTYTVSDPFGATGIGTISVTVEALKVSLVIQNLAQLPDGNMEVRASGIPEYSYLIQASDNATDAGSWTTIGTNAADSAGRIVFPDLDATNHTSRFYRLAAP